MMCLYVIERFWIFNKVTSNQMVTHNTIVYKLVLIISIHNFTSGILTEWDCTADLSDLKVQLMACHS